MKKLLFMIAMGMFLSLPVAKATNLNSNNYPLEDTTKTIKKEGLVVVWTSGDKEVAMKMVLMYTFNSKKFGWWGDESITLLIWGPSAKLLTEDKELQDYVKKIKDSGITVLACKACADMYKIADKLEEIGVTVRYTGQDLTNFIRERNVITF